MHRFDPDPAPETSLAVIDATLAGEAVEPEHAELAELTLILAGQRPEPSASFAAGLDERVARRFAAPASGPGRRSRRRWLYAPSAAFGVAAAVALVLVLSAGGPRRPIAEDLSSAPGLAARTSAGSTASVPHPPATGALPQGALPKQPQSGLSSGQGADAARHAPGTTSSGPRAASSGASATSSTPSATSSTPSATSLTPDSGAPASADGRKVIQSAQLALSTRPSQVDGVARQVFEVVGAQNGFVQSSDVTANNSVSGSAQFQLSVPSANLAQTMSALSRLRGAAVVSRTDSTQDVTGQLGGAGRRLADARALRTALLRRLAAATTTTAIDSLKIQIRDAEASISSDLATLRSLQHHVDFTQISLTINASMAPGHPVSSGGSFTIGRAAHDAGRVLVVAAGVALIALAVLVPLGMVAAMVAWVAHAIRRRRREQALDLV
ncbi:MAG: DUF4349 domain-containing protein [Solirubrobacteraceae bacterium]